MKNIAIVTNTSWNILNFRSCLIKELQKDYNVILVAPKDTFSKDIEQLATVVYLNHLDRKGTNPFRDLQLIQELTSVYQKYAIDGAIHFTIKPNIYGSIAAHRANIPSIAVVTGLGFTFFSKGVAAKIAKRLYAFAFKRNTITIFQNHDDRNLFLNSGMVSPKKSKVILGSGIDLSEFKPLPKTDWLDGFHFLFIGRFLYDKGFRELLEAFQHSFASNEQVHLHLIGTIDYGNPSAFSESELQQICEKNPRIHVHGYIDHPNQYIANANCVVLPSYREGLPRVMLEALAMAKPVITTRVAGCKETVIDGQNGLLCVAQDANDLAEKMVEMVGFSEQKRIKMGKRGKKLAEKKFSSIIINKRYKETLDSLFT